LASILDTLLSSQDPDAHRSLCREALRSGQPFQLTLCAARFQIHSVELGGGCAEEFHLALGAVPDAVETTSCW
jgi:hypothetical protein